MGYIRGCTLATPQRSNRRAVSKYIAVSFYLLAVIFASSPASAQQSGLTFNTTQPGQSVNDTVSINYSLPDTLTGAFLCENSCDSDNNPRIAPGETLSLNDGAQWALELTSNSCPPTANICQSVFTITFTSPGNQPSGSVNTSYNAQFRVQTTDASGASTPSSTSLVANYSFETAPSIVQFGTDIISGEEGTVIDIPVTRTGSAAALTGSLQAEVFLITSGNSSATRGEDYTWSDQVLNWADGVEGTRNAQVTLLADSLPEDREDFQLGVRVFEGNGVTGQITTLEVGIDDPPQSSGNIRFSQTATTVREDAGSVVIQVERVGGSSGDLSVIASTSNGSALAGQDYTDTTSTLSWADQETGEKSITIPVLADQNIEDGEQFTVGIVAASGTPASVITVPRIHTVNLTNVDPPSTGTIRFSLATASVAEDAGSIAVAVQRVDGTAGTLSVRVATVDGTATEGSDYEAISTDLTWGPGEDTEQTVNIPILSDAISEQTEQFTVRLTRIGDTPASAIGTPSSQAISITDIPPPATGTIRFSQATASVDEDSGSIEVTVQRTGGTAGPISVRVATADDSATAGADYTANSEVLTWPAGNDADQTISIPILSDSNDEPTEQFFVRLTPSGNTPASAIGTPASQTISITDIAPPAAGTIRFSQATASVAENAGTIGVTIRRVGGSAGPISVLVETADDSATAGADYTAFSEVLSWAGGNNADQTINIPIRSDNINEPTEQFTVRLTRSGDTPASAIGTPATQTISITDNTPDPAGVIQFNTATASAAENAGSVSVAMERVGGTAGSVSVRVATRSGTATAAEDYTAISRIVTWIDGDDAAKNLTVAILEDSIEEPNEQFTIVLLPDTSSEASSEDDNIGTPAVVTVTITDIAPPPAGRLQFSRSTDSVNEDAGNIEISVTRVDGTEGELSASITTQDDTATSGQDYTGIATPLVLTWANGESAAQTIRIPINNDGVEESAEQFTAQLAPANGTPAEAIGSPNTITVVINNVQPPATGTIRFSTASQRVSEDAGQASISIERTGGDDGELTVSVVSADGSAVSGSDYTGLADTLVFTWANNDSSPKQFTVPIINDSEIEGDETFTLSLASENPGIISNPDTHTVTISDVSSAGTLSFASASVSAEESGGTITVTVDRKSGTDGAVSVDYATQPSTATAGADYESATGTLNWTDGDATSKTFQLEINADSFNEDQEQFFVNLSNATPLGDSVQLGTPSRLTVNIPANGTASPGTVSFEDASLSTPESTQSVDLLVTRNGGDAGALSVNVATADGSATAGTDYTALSTVLTWADGEAGAKPVSIALTEDTLFEEDETFTVQLTTENTDLIGAIDTVLVTIENNDEAPVVQVNAGTIRLSSIGFKVAESDGSLEVDVIRSNGSGGAVSVQYALDNGSAVGGQDFTNVNGEISWEDGETGEQTITIPILEDDIEEPDETFTLRLFNETAPANHTLTIASRTATIEVTDTTEVGTIRLLTTTLTVDENDGFVTVSAERVDGDDGDISVDVIVSGVTAEDGVDFSQPAANLSWASGEDGIKSVEIPILRDQLIEDDESFTVSLSSGSPNVDIDPNANETTVIIEDASPPLDSQYDLIILSGDEQLAIPGDTLLPLAIGVRSNNAETQLQPAVNVRWRVEPAGAARLIDGDITVSDENGETSNRVQIEATGFIYIIATALGETEETPAASATSRVDPTPPNLVQGQVAFIVRSGLEGIPGLTLNQSKTAAALDDTCATLTSVQQANEDLTPAQADLLQTCQALDLSDDLAADLDRLAPEELFAIADSIIDTVDIQVTNIYSRINAIRSGQTDKLDLADLQLQIYDQTIPGSVLDAAQNALSQNAADDGNSFNSGFFSRFGFFVSGALSTGEIDGDGIQQDADVTTSGVTFGADYRVTDSFVVGAGLGTVQNETEFTSSRGGADISGSSLSLFSTWYETDKGYFDVVFDIGQNSYNIERQINLNGTATDVLAFGETDATVYAFTLSAGRNFNNNGFEFGPYLRLALVNASVDSYTERTTGSLPGFGSALRIRSHDVRSTSLTIGAQLSKSISTSFGVLLPQVRVEYETENETRKNGITASFVADPNDTAFSVEGAERDESYANFGIGSSVLLKNGKSGFLFYETRAQHDYVTQHWLKLGVRMEF